MSPPKPFLVIISNAPHPPLSFKSRDGEAEEGDRDDTGIGVLAGEARKTTTMIKMMMTQSAVCVEELPHNQSVI